MKLIQRLRLKPGAKVDLSDHDPGSTPGCRNKAAAQKPLERSLARLDALAYRLYAENRRSLLVVLQGMDAAGKDGAIRNVMTGLNPQGVTVTSFKSPSAEELGHDFLWRIHRAVPERGDIGIFNRSHYEDVLVVRVHDLVPKAVWSKRYGHINAFERMLADSGATIVKFFLHVSPEEQLRRFRARIEDPARHWKLNLLDFEERKRWDDYMHAYQVALTECGTPWAPWHVIPADHKWYRNLAIAQVLVETLEEMNPKFPKPTVDVSKITLE